MAQHLNVCLLWHYLSEDFLLPNIDLLIIVSKLQFFVGILVSIATQTVDKLLTCYCSTLSVLI